MTSAAATIATAEPFERPFIRRFEHGDVQRHAEWFIPRISQLLPHLTPGALQGWLGQIAASSEFLFLYQDRAIALAQLLPQSPKPTFTVQEVFVWAKDPKNETNVREAAYFYEHFVEWAKRKETEVVLIDIETDVPRKLISEIIGRRVFETRDAFVRVQE